MNAATRPYEADPMPFLAILAIACGAFISAPAVVLGIALARVARRARIEFVLLAALGIAWTVLARDMIQIAMHRAGRAAERAGALEHPQVALAAAWPYVRTWWLLATPLCFAVALGIDLLRRRSVEQLRERDERRAERARARAERRARRALGVVEERRAECSFELGQHISGDHVLPERHGRALMPLSRLQRTALVIGAPGSGKTITLGRLAYGVATTSEWQVIVIDAKGDELTQQRFADTMRRAGRGVRHFPQEPYDAWRGTGREIANRLVQLIDWADEGGGAYYRDLSTNLIRLACTPPDGPPRSSRELLARLDKTGLLVLWAGRAEAQEIERFHDEHIDACRQRYRSFFDATDGQLDGSWALEDADCAYLLLNELLYAEETSKVARFLIEDFKQYLAGRNPERRQVLLIIDEFSAIADGERMARMVEVVRSYGAAVVLAPQAFEGMGGPEAAARILNAAHTVILHAVPDPDAIIKAAGTRMATEWSLQHERGISTDVGSSRSQHQMRIDPNEVRRLSPGMAFVIGNGKGEKLHIAAPTRSEPPPARDAVIPPQPLREDLEPEGPIRL
jgi:type IV secretory system conjugative DNA transfer VirD4/TraG family protein